MLQRVLLLLFVTICPAVSLAQSGVPFSVDIVAHVPGCGDGVVQSGEQCDGSTMGGASCSTIGFSSGVLSCSTACTYITDQCVLTSPKPLSAGTRVMPAIQEQITNLVIAGYAPVNSMVTLLKDGQAVGVGVANAQGEFQITVVGLSEGTHLMKITAEQVGSLVATSDTFNVRVIEGATTKVSGVLVAPIITTLKEENNQLLITGNTLPGAVVSIAYDKQIEPMIVSADGSFSVVINHVLESRYIKIVLLYRGQQVSQIHYVSMPEERNPCAIKTDVSRDCRVNIVDFTTVVYSYLRHSFRDRFDFNKDGEVDLVDFSIMAFYWTG